MTSPNSILLPSLRPLVCLAALATALTAGGIVPAAPAQRADFSGLDPFWTVAELLAADREVPSSAWQAMFVTPGYRTLQERDNAQRFFQRLLPLALAPARREEAAATKAGDPALGMFIDHLSAAYERRAELEAFAAELEERPLLDEALAAAEPWLPAGTAARFGPPAISFVLYQPDARGYDHIVMDLLLAFEQPTLLDGLLAHETHHVLRSRIQGSRNWKDLPEAGLLTALDNLQAEGIADLIDKPSMMSIADWGDGSTGHAFRLMIGRLREAMEQVPQQLAELDTILAEYAADPGAAERLGARLRQTLVIGGHPAGYHMARQIVASGGRERMIDHVADPFDFVRAYRQAAATDPSRRHVLGREALRGLARLACLADESSRASCDEAVDAGVPPP